MRCPVRAAQKRMRLRLVGVKTERALLVAGVLGDVVQTVPRDSRPLKAGSEERHLLCSCLLYTSPSPRDRSLS
eukprot:4097489-Pyramimonas_sp.AAC.1